MRKKDEQSFELGNETKFCVDDPLSTWQRQRPQTFPGTVKEICTRRSTVLQVERT